jgi:hypothetical protein
MFESPAESDKKVSRRRSTVVVGATAVIFAVIIGIVLFVSRQRTVEISPVQPAGLPEAYRAGSPEFDAYRQFVSIEAQEPRASENLLGQVLVEARGILRNGGNRTLTGVEVRAIVYDAGGNLIADRVATPVPKMRPQLGPGESMPIQVGLVNVPGGTNPTVAEIVLHGLRFDTSQP